MLEGRAPRPYCAAMGASVFRAVGEPSRLEIAEAHDRRRAAT